MGLCHGRFRILLVGAEDEENLALRSLAAYLLQEGMKPVIVPYTDPHQVGDVLQAVHKHKPALVALSLAFQCLADNYFELVRELRRDGYRGHVIVGGHFATFEYLKILETQPGIDSVGRFEGEMPLVHLALAIQKGGDLSAVPDLVHRTASGIVENAASQELVDLDRLPFPLRNRRAQTRLGESFATLVSSRGCWHSGCSYCCIGAFHRQRSNHVVRLRSAEKVARELAWLHRSKGVRLFQFHDDNFVLRTTEETQARISSLRRCLQQAKIPLARIALLVKARPDTIDDSVAAELKALGCVGVFLGVENASESGLKALIRRAHVQDTERAIAGLTRQGIGMTYNLLIFHPHATMDEINQNIEFVRRHIAIPFDFGRAEIVAGSPLERLMTNEGRLRGKWPHWDYEIKDRAVQKMFEFNRDTFRRPDSPYSPAMHELIALSYHAHALTRLHPGPISDALATESTCIVTRANRFILECLERLRDLSVQEYSFAPVEELNRRLSDGCARVRREAWHLTKRMERLQFVEGIFRFFGVREAVQEGTRVSTLLGCRVDGNSTACGCFKTAWRPRTAEGCR